MNQEEKTLVRGAIDEMVNSFTRVQAEKDLQKEIVYRIKDDTTVTPRIFKKMAQTAYRASFAEEKGVFEEFEALYEEIVAGE